MTAPRVFERPRSRSEMIREALTRMANKLQPDYLRKSERPLLQSEPVVVNELFPGAPDSISRFISSPFVRDTLFAAYKAPPEMTHMQDPLGNAGEYDPTTERLALNPDLPSEETHSDKWWDFNERRNLPWVASHELAHHQGMNLQPELAHQWFKLYKDLPFSDRSAYQGGPDDQFAQTSASAFNFLRETVGVTGDEKEIDRQLNLLRYRDEILPGSVFLAGYMIDQEPFKSHPLAARIRQMLAQNLAELPNRISDYRKFQAQQPSGFQGSR